MVGLKTARGYRRLIRPHLRLEERAFPRLHRLRLRFVDLACRFAGATDGPGTRPGWFVATGPHCIPLLTL